MRQQGGATMKLLFPNGEHGPAEIRDGVTRVGSGADADVTIVAPGVASQHCEMVTESGATTLRVANPANVVVVNGKQVQGDTTLKPGDLVLFARVGARVVATVAPVTPVAPVPRQEVRDDPGMTRVRQALPRFALRGVSGTTFGKTFPLFGTMTVGRAADCGISIPAEEISRQHARLQVMPDGIAVEDLGSANGTFIAGKRVTQGTLHPGEELRLDTVRFLLVAPGMEVQPGPPRITLPATPAPRRTPSWVWILVGMAAAGLVIASLVYSGVLQ